MNSRLRMMMTSLAVASTASLIAWTAHGKMTIRSESPSFVYVLVETQFKNGAITSTQTSSRAMRKDGSYVIVTELKAADGTEYERREIFDLATMRRTVLYPGVETSTTIPISPDLARSLRWDRGGRCGAGRDATISRLNGYDVVLLSAPPMSLGDNQVLHSEQWLAPSLACVPLRLTWTIGGQIAMSQEAGKIVRGDPPTTLFQVPSHYEEVSPVTAAQRVSERFKTSAPNPEGSAEKQIEKVYFESRREAGWK